MSVIRNLSESPDKWEAGGCPLVSMMDIERRKGKNVPVIKKALVELKGPLFGIFAQERESWKLIDNYRAPGPIQFENFLPSPFLVKAPTKESLYFNKDKNYPENSIPYAPTHPSINLSDLAYSRIQEKPQLPQLIETQNYKVISSSPLEYVNEETKLLAYEEYKLLTSSKKSTRLVEIIPKEQGLLSTQEELSPIENIIRIGIVFCGRQCPGAHNVIGGLVKFAQSNKAQILGFLGGTKGFFKQKFIEVTPNSFELYNNQGGFHYLGRTADKIRSPEELENTLKACLDLKLSGLVLLGATHTLTDSMIVSDYLLEKQCDTRVIAVPATVDGNLYHHMLEAIIGFDTSSKLYSQMIGNIMIDAASAVKYWYFIRLMGRIPSHLVLECALQTQPNMVLISEEIAEHGKSLKDVVNDICDLIVLRSENVIDIF